MVFESGLGGSAIGNGGSLIIFGKMVLFGNDSFEASRYEEKNNGSDPNASNWL
jgi:hypothetical protein